VVRTAILYDGPSSVGATPDLLIIGTVERVEEVLRGAGHQTERVPVFPGGEWIAHLARGEVDLVFNLCEGIDGVAEAEPAVIGAIELLGLPYTGASPWATAVCLRKHMVNATLERAGLPIPRWTLARRGVTVEDIGYPAICKPAAEDASIGVEQRSVVRSRGELEERLQQMHTRWQEVLVQRFVDGREMNVGVIGSRVLPVSEIAFDGMPDGLWRIVSYRAKWETGSDEDLGTSPTCPAEIEPALAERLQQLASEAWQLLGGTGYARVDFRVDDEGPWILEVNANPDIAADAGLARMGRAAGLDYAHLIQAVCEEAQARPGRGMNAWSLAQRLSGLYHASASVAEDA
jgi:D-alanine-D-alanine ligase